jgi:asparagine synthase (glutamine-hydrolysing)
VDLWWRGQNVALDAGTFSYNAAPPWDDTFSSTAYHNTVAVDGHDQMERVGRFLWLPWATGSVQLWQRSEEGYLAYWEGSHNGYERLTGSAVHRRSLMQVAEHWLVLDRIISETEHEHRLHWLLMDVPYESDDSAKRLTLKTAAGPYRIEVGASNQSVSSIVRAESRSARGWRARYYNHREPALSLALIARSHILNFFTVFGAEPFTLTSSDQVLQLMTDRYQAKLDLQMNDNSRPLVTSMRIDGAIQAQLEIG